MEDLPDRYPTEPPESLFNDNEDPFEEVDYLYDLEMDR